MPSDQKPASPEQAELAELQLWDRVEGRLWSRARMILIATVVLVLLVALLGVPLVEERLARRVTARAESLIAERVAALNVDMPSMRQEIRSETQAQRQELLRTQFALEKRITGLLERTRLLDDANENLVASSEAYETVKAQILAIQQSLKNEEERLHKLRTTHEKELAEFRAQSEALLAQIPRLTTRELRYDEDIVNRDLDELRLIIADQMVGKPAIYATYVNLSQRDGQITGVNLGDERGNVFVRVRAFRSGAAEPFSESDSILLQSTQWNNTRINLRFPAPALEKIQEAQLAAATGKPNPPKFRYGFVIQTAEGKMSQWSGLRVDSLIPPTNLTPTDD